MVLSEEGEEVQGNLIGKLRNMAITVIWDHSGIHVPMIVMIPLKSSNKALLN